MSALVSVLMPVRDVEEWVGEALDSALAQDHAATEIIVADDGSRDRTADVAAQRPGVTVLRRGAPGGPAAARNTALEHARGDFVAVLDGDDIWPANRLSLQLAHFAANPELAIVLGLTEAFVNPGEPMPPHHPRTTEPFHACAGAMLARREVFEEIGHWDERLRLCEDVDWLARAKDAGFQSGAVEEIVLRYRIHARNTSRNGVLRESLERRRRA
jgi:glycosyltransferase involved in cell wall biosynthesis